jgi:hypothetical protein
MTNITDDIAHKATVNAIAAAREKRLAEALAENERWKSVAFQAQEMAKEITARSDTEIARLRRENAALVEASKAVIDAHDVVISIGSLGGPFKRHLEEPLWNLRTVIRKGEPT